MSIQIFKNNVPNHYLFNLLDNICVKIKNYYIINYASFKKGTYNTYISDFITFPSNRI